MRYVIGVEGTQAGTTTVVADATGCVLGIHHGVALPLLHETGGWEGARRGISEGMQGAIAMADLQNARFAAACLGLGEKPEVLEALCVAVVPAERLLFAPLSRLALASVTFGKPGVAAFAGAGAMVCGVNAAGEIATAGGWGGIICEEGSGSWIAARALSACCRAVDGVGPQTAILPLLLAHLEATDFREVYCRLSEGALTPPRVLALMDLTRLAAAQGDAVALRILREAGRELGVAVSVTLRRLGMEKEQPTVGTVGEVFQAGRLVLRTFREVVQRSAGGAVFAAPQTSMAVGAVVLALTALGVEITETVQTHLSRPALSSR